MSHLQQFMLVTSFKASGWLGLRDVILELLKMTATLHARQEHIYNEVFVVEHYVCEVLYQNEAHVARYNFEKTAKIDLQGKKRCILSLN